MKLRSQLPFTRRAARLFDWAPLLLLALVVLAVSPAKADTVFNVSANVLTGPYAGLNVLTGTIDIDTVTGVATALDLTLSNDPSLAPFTSIGGGHGTCTSPNCVYFSNAGFANFGQLILGKMLGYTGGTLGASGGNTGIGSFIDVNSGGYSIDGTVTPQGLTALTLAHAPEPSSLVLMALGMIGLLFMANRQGLIQGL